MSDSSVPLPEQRQLHLTVNGIAYTIPVEPRWLLSDVLRHSLHLTGTHVGCEHGVCGACTILFNGTPIRSCLMFAIQADGGTLLTVEGLAQPDGTLHAIQQAFHTHHALQCGFCTPGFLMATYALLQGQPNPNMSDEELRAALAGNLCRCTGYQGLVAAVRSLLQTHAHESQQEIPAFTAGGE